MEQEVRRERVGRRTRGVLPMVAAREGAGGGGRIVVLSDEVGDGFCSCWSGAGDVGMEGWRSSLSIEYARRAPEVRARRRWWVSHCGIVVE